MTDSMMPEGVEHDRNADGPARSPGVTDSMMPEGVEHAADIAKAFVDEGDRFHDAGRR